MMHFHEVEKLALKVLQNANGQYLFPYQIFTRLKDIDPVLGQKIENEYPVQPGNPPMGEGAGRPYSSANFIAQALNYFYQSKKYSTLDKRCGCRKTHKFLFLDL